MHNTNGKNAWVKSTRIYLAIMTVYLFLAGTGVADAVLVDVTVGDASGGFQSRAPFGNIETGPSTRYQQIYNAALFPTLFTITTVTFFDTGFGSIGDTVVTSAIYDMRLSTTTQSVNGLDNVNFDNNVGSDEATFFFGPLGGSLGGNPEFSLFGSSFDYSPSNGNLLLDIRRTNTVNTTGPGSYGFFDAYTQNVSDDTSLVTDFGFEGGGTSGDAFLASSTGLVTRFTGPDIPEPTSFLLLSSGLLGLAGTKRHWRHI